jgi:antirestriction protein ArdC
MPERSLLAGSVAEAQHAMLLQELVRWTGARHRLDRTVGHPFGEDANAIEELVAELGGAFLCTRLGVANPPQPSRAGYVASWLKVLRRDPRAIFAVARNASTAAEYLVHFGALS